MTATLLGPSHHPHRAVPCRTDIDLWFAEHTAPLEEAKRRCHSCPVRASCLETALARREPWGVWGGQILVDGVVVPTKRGRGRPAVRTA